MINVTDGQLWNLNGLYHGVDAPELEHDLAKGVEDAQRFRLNYQGKVASLNAGGLLSTIREYEALQELLLKPQLYAHLLFAADSEDDRHKTLSQRAMEFGNQMSRELLFFDLELMAIDDATFATLLQLKELSPYAHFLESVRRFKPHTLAEREEQLLKLKSLTGVDAFSRLFDELSSSYRFELEMDGETRQMTGEELLALVHHPDHSLRERAFSLFLDRHRADALVYGAVFNTITLDHSQELELRSYPSPMAPTHL
ncbi:MAG TPA: oligoendopeptidase F, partial [Geobacterales bacterium]|nr:oligoendopeptidase F [Geobacterales bacterium]